MGSFQPTNTLLLLAATEPSSWSFHLSSMFVGMMCSGVVLAKCSLSSGSMTLRAFNFNKLSISLNLDASNFSCPFPTAHHTPHHSCLWVWALNRKLVFQVPILQLLASWCPSVHLPQESARVRLVLERQLPESDSRLVSCQLAVAQLVVLRFPRRRTHVVRFSGGSSAVPSPEFCSTQHRATRVGCLAHLFT